ncbi:MAG: hypothetical protein DSY50_03025 [Desulfobulbus sp.]|nr:MAG: hypothetical protein DSY50_03025 [Desulfobulbus sp.]
MNSEIVNSLLAHPAGWTMGDSPNFLFVVLLITAVCLLLLAFFCRSRKKCLLAEKLFRIQQQSSQDAEKYHTLLRHGSVGFFAMSTGCSRVVEVNDSLCAMLGLKNRRLSMGPYIPYLVMSPGPGSKIFVNQALLKQVISSLKLFYLIISKERYQSFFPV